MQIFGTIPLYPGGQLEGIGTLGLEGASANTGGQIFASVISSTIGVITIVAIIWFVISLILSAVQIITAGIDKNKVGEARTKMANAAVGLIVVISAIFIANIVGYIFDIPIFNITVLINYVGL